VAIYGIVPLMKQVAAPGRTRSGYRGLHAYGYQPHIETANDAVFSVATGLSHFMSAL
jgi:hypothetical protein